MFVTPSFPPTKVILDGDKLAEKQIAKRNVEIPETTAKQTDKKKHAMKVP